MRFSFILATLLLLIPAAALLLLPDPLLSGSEAPDFDVIVRNGSVYDGAGGNPMKTDVGVRGDRIAAIGDLRQARAKVEIDARGLAVAPGFINMLSWSTVSLILDPRSQGEIRQGVTTEIMGEGESMGPLTEEMKRRMISRQGDWKYDIAWTTLAEYLACLESRGVTPNVASFIGTGTIRQNVVGLEDRKATPAELEKMCELVRREMEAGALGVGSSLAYAPDTYATTEELTAMSRVAAKYGGMYISHVRSEGDRLVESVEELIRISREASIPAEIYHLKAGGEKNWPKMDRVIALVEAARREGLRITADMYLYTASSNRLSSRIPAWAQEGGDEELLRRLQDPATRQRIASELRLRGVGARTLLVGFESEALRPLTGKTLAEVARMRKKDTIDTMLDLVVEDRAFTRVVAFSMSEDNVKKELRLPWVSFGSDAASIATEGVFIKASTHPRAYGNFARLLGKYVREEKVIPLKEAIRRLTALPASNLGLDRRGLIGEGFFADIVVFDPETIADKATYENPHQYATGVKHVLVNGVPVLKDGEHTGATPGRALWGRGKAR